MTKLRAKFRYHSFSRLFLPVIVFLLPLLLLGGTVSNAAAPSPGQTVNSNMVVVRVYFRNNAERDRLAVELGAEEAATTGGYLTVIADQEQYSHILTLGLKTEIDQAQTEAFNNIKSIAPSSPDTFFGGFKTVEEMQAFMSQYATNYPTLASVVDYGDSYCKQAGGCTFPTLSWAGYDLKAMHITNQAIAGPKPVFWFEAGIHSREIATPEVAANYIQWLLDNYNSDPEAHWLVDYTDIWVIPMVNPDGHHIVEAGGSGSSPYYQRKNADNTTNCNVWPPEEGSQAGVDNNRNFPFLWNCCGGSSSAPCDETFHGTSGSSDPETTAVVNELTSLVPDQRGPNIGDAAPITATGVFQDMHSNASLDLYPWGMYSTAAPNGPELAALGHHLSATNAYPAGNNYQACQPPLCLYAVDGDAFDWAYGELGMAGFSTEVGGSDFLVPLSYVQNTLWPANKGALIYQAKAARQPYLLAHGPDASGVASVPMTVTQGTTAALTATINYAWTGDSLSQNVGAAEYYIDTPPWAGGTAVAMSGSFGSAQTVVANANIDTSSLSVGRHIVFVRGRGVNQYMSNDTWGPVTAAWLWVTEPLGSPTPTVTGTPPTATETGTPTETPQPTSTPCNYGLNYAVATTTGATVVPGTNDVGNHCDDCTSSITLPFPYTLYDQTFTNAYASSDGNLGFGLDDSNYQNSCLPDPDASYTVFSYWDDLCTGACGSSVCTGCGIFTSTTGVEPNRIFNIEWRANQYNSNTLLDFETRLYEGQNRFDIVYGSLAATNNSETTGVQNGDGSLFTQYACNTNTPAAGLQISFTLPACATPTNTPEPTSTATSVPTETPTVCTLTFTDVLPGSTFYSYIHCLACLGIINGYPDGTFRPANNVTRGQLSKIVSNSAGFEDNQTEQTFQDVAVDSTFYQFVGRLSSRGYISGYPCGGVGEPCVAPGDLPYFRPNGNATRGQISKIDSNAAGYSDTPTGQQFEDVAVGSTYYDFIYRLVTREVMSGYPCGTAPAGPCVAPGNLPYFLPNNNATRGQTSKVVSNTFFPDCSATKER